MSVRRVAVLLWGSGFCALFYQTAWQRLFRLCFGASTAASAAVLAIFLGGLGAGGLLIGRRAQEHPRPLVLYGNLELGVAAAAAVSPFLADALGRAYLALGGVTALGQVTATFARLAITAIVIGPAAVFMGGTLPAAARAVESDGDHARSRLALLYGVNTLGAVTGALVGTFFLFELFGIRLALWTAVLLNVLVGLAARSIGRTGDELRETATETAPALPLRPAALLGVGVAGVVGFAFLLLEIVWYRLLAPILGGTTYTFGLVLAVALSGIGLGGYLYSLRDPSRAVTASDLALATAIEGVLVALPIALGDKIALYAILTRPLSSLGFGALVFAWTAITAVVVFPPALVSGYQFPLLFALLGSGRERVARHVGAIYAFNTAGALLGSLLGGFVLVPRLTAVGCYRVVAVLLLGLAVVSIVFEWVFGARRPLRRTAEVAALIAFGAVLVTRRGPTAVFRHLPIGAGRVEVPGRTYNELRAWNTMQNQSVLWDADGVETSVALTKGDQLAFVVDGKADGAVYTDRGTQAGAGLLVALMHPAPKRSLVIGLGTGMTAGFLAAVPTMEHVDVAELESSILHVARVCAKANLNLLARPTVAVHVGDGRELVLSAKGTYDVIASEPSNPYRAGVAALYTKEFYEAVAAHLAPDGSFLQWVQAYETDTQTLLTVAKTLSSVLSSVEAWQTEAGDIVFVASRKHRVLDVGRLRARLETEPFRWAFPRTLMISDVEGLLSRFVASDALIRELVAAPEVELNTDDRNVTEYAFARSVGVAKAGLTTSLLAYAMEKKQDRPDVVGSVDWDRVAELRPRAWFVGSSPAPELPMPNPAARARVAATAAACQGNGVASARAWAEVGGDPRDDIERYVVGLALADRGDERVTGYAAALASKGLLVESNLLLARHALALNDAAGAIGAVDRAVAALHDDPFPFCGAADQVLSAMGKLAQTNVAYRKRAALELLEKPFATYLVDDQRLLLAFNLAIGSGDPALCVKSLGPFLGDPRWDDAFLVQRLRCLSAANRPETPRAAADLLEYREHTVGKFGPQEL
jgi:spermidine synthase